MWHNLLKLNPNLIVRYQGNDEFIFETALKKGYKIKENKYTELELKSKI